MALETRPIPVLKGKMAEEFFKRAAECKVSKSREEIREITRKVRQSLERARIREEREREERERKEQEND
jgi:DNA repair photolyase